MFVSWAETKSICNASSLRTVAVFSSKLLHPSLDLCIASIFVNNIIQYIYGKQHAHIQSEHMTLEDISYEKDGPIHGLY